MDSTTRKRSSRVSSLVAAAATLGLGVTVLATPVLAVTYATVTDHVAFSNEANSPDFWESEGVTCEDMAGGSGNEFELPAPPAGMAYAQVIVKAGSGEFANTVFAEPPVAGETVWADTNGDGVANVGGQGGDAQISHIIICLTEAEEETPTPTASPTASPTPEGSVAGGTSTPTPEGSVQGGTGTPEPSQPDTAMGATGGPSPIPTVAFGLILLAALGTLAWANVKTARSRA